MAELHIYEKTGESWSKIAEGEGDIDRSDTFTVSLTSGGTNVAKWFTYSLRDGQSTDGVLCDCMTADGKTATFEVSPRDGGA